MQKTLQNAFGTFYQNVIGSIDGWEELGRFACWYVKRIYGSKFLYRGRENWNGSQAIV